ncbi:hypothetical protein [Liquorilactobacillus mali]|uniref:hypothetical protein n=1 Tax=Liquorilactobacillus mali TaxID=1618 RepID=UPI00024916EB|nr:hypothetical protein [Liquorilactobacillus mali]
MRISDRIYNQIVFVEGQIEKITENGKAQKNKLDIHDMADLERYSSSLRNLANALERIESLERSGVVQSG